MKVNVTIYIYSKDENQVFPGVHDDESSLHIGSFYENFYLH